MSAFCVVINFYTFILAVLVAGQVGARVNGSTGLAGRNGRIVAIVGASFVGAVCIAGVPVIVKLSTFLSIRFT